MAITQQEIADELGISLVSVARALNGQNKVSAESRQRIFDAAHRLGYNERTNHEAKALIAKRYGKSVKTGIIAVLTGQPLFEGEPIYEVPFFRPLLQGIEHETALRQMDLFLCSFHGRGLPRLVQDEQVDGVICLSTSSPELQTSSLPVVVFGSHSKWAHSLVPDDAGGARLATSHLLRLGHHRIAYLGFYIDPGHHASHQRPEGYLTALRQAGLEADHNLVEASLCAPTVEAGREGMARLLDRRHDFTALVCFNDTIAMGAIEEARSRGRRVPDDLSVVGFDDVTTCYDFAPTVTSIGFDRLTMGRRAVQHIIHSLDGNGAGAEGSSGPGGCEIFPVELQQHESTARYTDKFVSQTVQTSEDERSS